MKTEKGNVPLHEKYRLMQQITKNDDWEWVIDKNIIIWSEETNRIFGDSGVPVVNGYYTTSFRDYITRIPPPDRIQIHNALAEAKINESFSVKHRIIRSDKKVCIVNFQGILTRDEDNKPTGLVGAIQDITNLYWVF